MSKLLNFLWNKNTLLTLLIVSNILWTSFYLQDRISYKSQIEMLDGAYKHILEDKSLQINLAKQSLDSLAQIPKASTDEKEKELVIKYKKVYNIVTADDSSIRKELQSVFREPRKFSKEGSN